VTNKKGPPEEDRALRLDGRAGMVYWGDAEPEQAKHSAITGSQALGDDSELVQL